jgi:hypothetical protein
MFQLASGTRNWKPAGLLQTENVSFTRLEAYMNFSPGLLDLRENAK